MGWRRVPLLTTLLFMLVFIVIITSTIFASPNSCFVDFERWNQNIPYTHTMADKDFGYSVFQWGFQNSSSLSITASKQLLVDISKSSSITPPGEKDLFRVGLEPSMGYTLSYKLLFVKDFDFFKNGILPGMGGGLHKAPSDQKKMSGYAAMPMWTMNGTATLGTIQKNSLSKIPYETPSSVQFVSEKNYHVELRLTVRTPGSFKGRVELWLNHEKIQAVSDIAWTDNPDELLDTFLFLAGYQNNQQNKHLSKTNQILLDNISLSRIS